MIIRKHWKKFTLVVASLFWASCGSDSDSVSADPEEPVSSAVEGPISSERVDPASSGAVEPASSSSAVDPVSSEAVSSSSEYPYPLYSDPNVHCKDTTTYQYTNNCPKSTSPKYYGCNSYKELLSTNKYLSEEELVKMEKEALECNMPAPVYGVSYPVCNESYYSSVSYTCDDGKPFNRKYLLHEGVVYTQEEYNALFVSSSSVEPSSSEVSSSSVESSSSNAAPICQIDDFIDMNGASDSIRTAVVDGVIASKGDQISDGQKECLENIDPPMYHYNGGVIGKTKICSGEETVNDFYQEKVNELNDEIIPQIRECLGETEPSI